MWQQKQRPQLRPGKIIDSKPKQQRGCTEMQPLYLKGCDVHHRQSLVLTQIQTKADKGFVLSKPITTCNTCCNNTSRPADCNN